MLSFQNLKHFYLLALFTGIDTHLTSLTLLRKSLNTEFDKSNNYVHLFLLRTRLFKCTTSREAALPGN